MTREGPFWLSRLGAGLICLLLGMMVSMATAVGLNATVALVFPESSVFQFTSQSVLVTINVPPQTTGTTPEVKFFLGDEIALTPVDDPGPLTIIIPSGSYTVGGLNVIPDLTGWYTIPGPFPFSSTGWTTISFSALAAFTAPGTYMGSQPSTTISLRPSPLSPLLSGLVAFSASDGSALTVKASTTLRAMLDGTFNLLAYTHFSTYNSSGSGSGARFALTLPPALALSTSVTPTVTGGGGCTDVTMGWTVGGNAVDFARADVLRFTVNCALVCSPCTFILSGVVDTRTLASYVPIPEVAGTLRVVSPNYRYTTIAAVAPPEARPGAEPLQLVVASGAVAVGVAPTGTPPQVVTWTLDVQSAGPLHNVTSVVVQFAQTARANPVASTASLALEGHLTGGVGAPVMFSCALSTTSVSAPTICTAGAPPAARSFDSFTLTATDMFLGPYFDARRDVAVSLRDMRAVQVARAVGSVPLVKATLPVSCTSAGWEPLPYVQYLSVPLMCTVDLSRTPTSVGQVLVVGSTKPTFFRNGGGNTLTVVTPVSTDFTSVSSSVTTDQTGPLATINFSYTNGASGCAVAGRCLMQLNLNLPLRIVDAIQNDVTLIDLTFDLYSSSSSTLASYARGAVPFPAPRRVSVPPVSTDMAIAPAPTTSSVSIQIPPMFIEGASFVASARAVNMGPTPATFSFTTSGSCTLAPPPGDASWEMTCVDWMLDQASYVVGTLSVTADLSATTSTALRPHVLVEYHLSDHKVLRYLYATQLVYINPVMATPPAAINVPVLPRRSTSLMMSFSITSWADGDTIIVSSNTADLTMSAGAIWLIGNDTSCTLPTPVFSNVQLTLTYTLTGACTQTISVLSPDSAVYRPTSDISVLPRLTARVLRFTAGATHLLQTVVLNLDPRTNGIAALTPGGPVDAGKSQTVELTLAIDSTSTTQFLSRFDTIRIELPGVFFNVDPPYLRVGGAPAVPLRLGSESATSPSSLMVVAEVDTAVTLGSPVVIVLPRAEVKIGAPAGPATATVTIQSRSSKGTTLESWSGGIEVVALPTAAVENRTAVTRFTSTINDAMDQFDFYFELTSRYHFRSSPPSTIVLQMNSLDTSQGACAAANAVAYLPSGTISMSHSSCEFTVSLTEEAHAIRPDDTIRILMQGFVTASGQPRDPVTVFLKTMVAGATPTTVQQVNYESTADSGQSAKPDLLFSYTLAVASAPSPHTHILAFSANLQGQPSVLTIYFRDAGFIVSSVTGNARLGTCTVNVTNGAAVCSAGSGGTTSISVTAFVTGFTYPLRVDPMGITTAQMSSQLPYSLRVVSPNTPVKQARGYLSLAAGGGSPVSISQLSKVTQTFAVDAGTGRSRIDVFIASANELSVPAGATSHAFVAPKGLLGASAVVADSTAASASVTAADFSQADLASPLIVLASLSYTAGPNATFHLLDAGSVFGRHEAFRFTNNATSVQLGAAVPLAIFPTRFVIGPSPMPFDTRVVSVRSGDTNPLPAGSGALSHMFVWPNAAAVLFARDSSAVSYARGDLWRISNSHGLLPTALHPVRTLAGTLLAVLPSTDSRVVYAVTAGAPSSILILSAATMTQLSATNIAAYVTQFASTGPISFLEHFATGSVGEQLIACAADSCVVVSVDLDKFLLTFVATLKGASSTTRTAFPTFIGIARLGAANASDSVRLLTSDGQIVAVTNGALVTVPSGSDPSNGFVTIQSLPRVAGFSASSFIAGDSYGQVRIMSNSATLVTALALWSVPACSGLCPIRQLRATMPILLSDGNLDFYVFVLTADYALYSLYFSVGADRAALIDSYLISVASGGSGCLNANGAITHMDVASDNSNVYLGMANGRICTLAIPSQPISASQTSCTVVSVPFGNIPAPFSSSVVPTPSLAAGSLVTYEFTIQSHVILQADDKVQILLPRGSFTSDLGFAVTGLPGVTPVVAPLDASASTLDTQPVATFIVPASYTATQNYTFRITNMLLSEVDMNDRADAVARSSVTVRFATANGAVMMTRVIGIATLDFARDPYATFYPVISRSSHAAYASTEVTVSLTFHSQVTGMSLTSMACLISNPSGAGYDSMVSAVPTGINVSPQPSEFTMSRPTADPLFDLATLVWTAKLAMHNPAPTMATTATVVCVGSTGTLSYTWRGLVSMPPVYGPSSTALGPAVAIPSGLPLEARISSVTASRDRSVFVAVTDQGHIFAYHASGDTYVPGVLAQPLTTSFTHVTGGRDLRFVYASTSTGDVYRFPRVMDTHGDAVYTKKDLYIAKSGIASHLFVNPLLRLESTFPQASRTPRVVDRVRQLFTVDAYLTPTPTIRVNPVVDADGALGLVSITARGLFGLSVTGAQSYALTSTVPSPVSCFPWLSGLEASRGRTIYCATDSNAIMSAITTSQSTVVPSLSSFNVSSVESTRIFGDAILIERSRVADSLGMSVEFWVGTKAGYIVRYTDSPTSGLTRTAVSPAISEVMTALAVTPDGQTAFVGTVSGSIYRFSVSGNLITRADIPLGTVVTPAADTSLPGNRAVLRLFVTGDGSTLVGFSAAGMYTLKISPRMCATRVTFDPVTTERQFSDGDSSRATSMRIEFDWSITLASPFKTLAASPTLLVDLTLPEALRSRYGSLIDFRRSAPAENSVYSFLPSPGQPTVLDSTAGSIACQFAQLGTRLLCDFSDVSSLVTDFQSRTSATLVVPGVVTPNYIVTDSHINTALGFNNVSANAFQIAEFTSAAKLTGAFGLLHVVIANSNDTIPAHISSSAQRMQIVFNPPLYYRDSSFTPMGVTITNDIGCVPARYDTSGFPLSNRDGPPCCAFNVGGNYLSSVSRDIPSEVFVTRLDFVAVCTITADGIPVTVTYSPGNERTEQRRYQTVTHMLRVRAKYDLVILRGEGASTQTNIAMKTGSYYEASITFSTGNGPSFDDTTVTLVAPLNCYACLTQDTATCGASAQFTVAAFATSASKLYTRCNVAGLNIGSFSLIYDPTNDDVPYDVSSVSVYEVTGSLNVRLPTSTNLTNALIPTNVDMPVSITIDNPALSELKLGVSFPNSRCIAHNNEAEGVVFLPTIPIDGLATSFFIRCTLMIHEEDVFRFTVFEIDNGMSPGTSPLISTFGIASIYSIERDLGTGTTTNSPVTENPLNIVAADIQGFRVGVTPPPTRGSLLQIEVLNPSAITNCRIDYAEAIPQTLDPPLATLNVVAYDGEFFSEPFYVICDSPTVGTSYLELKVSQIAGDKYRYSTDVSNTDYNLALRSMGELRLYQVNSDGTEENLGRDSMYYLPVLAVTDLRVDLLPATGNPMTFQVTWSSSFSCEVLLADGINYASSRTVDVGQNKSEIALKVRCKVAVLTSVAYDNSLHSLTIVDVDRNYPELAVKIRVNIPVNMLLLDDTEVPTGVAVDAPLHVHISSVYTTSNFKLEVSFSDLNGQCRLALGTSTSPYSQLQVLDMTDGQSPSMYIRCSATSTGALGTTITITSGNTTSYLIKPWSLEHFISSGSIYISSSVTDANAALPSTVQVLTPLPLYVHLIPACTERTTFTFTKTISAGAQPDCGFTTSMTAALAATDPIQPEISVIIEVNNDVSPQTVYFRCDTVQRGGPSIVVTPSLSAYMEYYGSTILPRGSYSFLDLNSQPLGSVLPFQVAYRVRVKLLPQATSELGYQFVVSRSSFAARCVFATTEAQASTSTSDSLSFDLSASSVRDELAFYIYCAEAAATGPALVVTPGTNVLYAVGTSGIFSITGLVRAVSVNATTGLPLAGVPFVTEISIDQNSEFTLYMLPTPVEDVMVQVSIAPPVHCLLYPKNQVTGVINVTQGATALNVTVLRGVVSPSVPVVQDAARSSIVIKCTQLPGSLSSPKLYMKQVSTNVESHYADFVAFQEFSIYGSMSVLPEVGPALAATINAGDTYIFRVVLNPSPLANTQIRAAIVGGSSTTTGDCVMSITGEPSDSGVTLAFTPSAEATTSLKIRVKCRSVSNPAAFKLGLTHISGERYTAFTSADIRSISVPKVTLYGTNVVDVPTQIQSHTATRLQVSIAVPSNSPASQPTTMNVVLNNTAAPLTGQCKYSTNDNFSSFDSLPNSFSASFAGNGQITAPFYIYCKLPVHTANLPMFSITPLTGVQYESYTSSPVVIRARTCSAYTPPTYADATVNRDAGGFYTPTLYPEFPDEVGLYVFGNTLTYQCRTGYSLSNSATVAMTQLRCDAGQWVGSAVYTCRPVDCGPLNFDAPALFVSSTPAYARKTSPAPQDQPTTFQGTATLSCITGYAFNQIVGSSPKLQQISTCNAAGQWAPAPQACAPVDCYAPHALPDGGAPPTTEPNGATTYGSTVSYTCLDGYALFDSELKGTCNAQGEWTHADGKPRCESLHCITLMYPDNGYIEYSQQPVCAGGTCIYPSAAQAVYHCNHGYRVTTGEGADTRECGTGGWMGLLPACWPIVCEAALDVVTRVPLHGTHVMIMLLNGGLVSPASLESAVTFGMKLQFYCEIGYDPSTVLECDDPGVGSTGVFTGGVVSCDIHICPSISTSIAHLKNIAYHELHPREYETTATYECETGFRPFPPSASTKTCNELGVEWLPATQVTCEAVQCPRLPDIVNGGPITINYGPYSTTQARFGASAVYSCASGYHISGNSTRECLADGTWSGSAPTCAAFNCGTLPSSALYSVAYVSGGFGPTSLDATASFTCSQGYRLTTAETSKCVEGGWSVAQITCVDIDECAYLDCASIYGAGSYCINTIGKYVCAPYISSGSVTVSGLSKVVTVQYPLVGVVNENTKNIQIIDTAGRDLLSFNAFRGYGLAGQTGPSAGGTIRAVRYNQTITPFLSFSCDIQSITEPSFPQYQRVACLTSASAGLVLPLELEFCSTNPFADDPTGSLCRWTPVRDSSLPLTSTATYSWVYRLNYPAPTTARATLRSVTYEDRTGRANLVGRSLDGEMVAIYGTGFLNIAGAMTVTYGPAGNEAMHVCTVNTASTTPTIMVCRTQDGVVGVDLAFRIVVSGQAVVSTDRYSYPLQLVLSSVSGCEDPSAEQMAGSTHDCPTAGGRTLTIAGDGFLDPSAAYANGIECPIVVRQNKILECTLPAGTGQSVSVIVSSGTQYIEGQGKLSYAAPTITSVSSDRCSTQNETYLYDCPRSSEVGGPALITVIGTNFGAEGAAVYVGGSPCTSATHGSDVSAHRLVTCVLPTGTTLNNQVTLVQMYGETSTEEILISYVQCRAGLFTSGTTCQQCPLGTYTSESGQTDCKSCPAGTFNGIAGSSTCLTCPAGSYSGVGSVRCNPCPKGTFSAAGSGLCTTCAVGTYSNKMESATCQACPFGGSSDPDYAGCHCNAGFYINPIGNCEACMLGANCDEPQSTYFNVKALPGFYPTALATDTGSPHVKRFEVDLATDVDLTDDYASQVFFAQWYEAMFNETGVGRLRVQIVSSANAFVARPSTGTDGGGDSSSGGNTPIESFVAPSVPAPAAVSHRVQQADTVPGVRLLLDIYPEILKSDESADAVATRLWNLIKTPSTYMAKTFGSSVSRVSPVDGYSRTAYVAFEACLYDSCQGGDTLCSPGYQGPLCTVCAPGYGKKTTYQCESCGPLGTRIAWMLLSLFLAIFIVGVLVVLSVRDTTKNLHLPRAIRPSSVAAFCKVIVCVIQVWAIAAQYDIVWPGFLSGLMEAADAAGSVGVSASSLDCFSSSIDSYGPAWSAALRPLFLTSVGVFILPFLAALIPLLFLLPIWLVHRRRYTSVLNSVSYTLNWSSQMESELKKQRDALQAVIDAENNKNQYVYKTTDESGMRNEKYVHSKSAFSARRDLVASSTAQHEVTVPPEFANRANAAEELARASARRSRANSMRAKPGSGPLAPPVRPPSPSVNVDDDIAMRAFHVDDFVDGAVSPRAHSAAGSSGRGLGAFEPPSTSRQPSTTGQRSMLRGRSSLMRREMSFRDSITVGDRVSNKGLRLRDVAMEEANQRAEAAAGDGDGSERSRTGTLSRLNTMTGFDRSGRPTATAVEAAHNKRSKKDQDVDQQSADNYVQFQRDKRVYRLMIDKLADLRSYYTCVYLCCIVVALYLFHPNITRSLFRLIGCKTVGSSSSAALDASLASTSFSLSDVVLPHSSMKFVLADMSMECYSGEHLAWIFSLGLIIFAVWVVGIPLVFFLFTYRNRLVLRAQPNALPSNEMRLRRNLEYTFAFLYLGFDARSYYWFLADMISKVLYVAIAIFFPGEMHIQFLLASFVTFAVISAQTAVRPFDSVLLEQLQFAALLCTFICFFLSNFFVVDTELSTFGVDFITYVIFVALILFFFIAALTVALMYRHDRRTASIREAVATAIRRNLDPIPLLQEWQRNELERKAAKRSARAAGFTANLREINIRDVAADVQEELEQYLDNSRTDSSNNGPGEIDETLDAALGEEVRRQRHKKIQDTLDAEIGQVLAKADGDGDESAASSDDEDAAAAGASAAKPRSDSTKAPADKARAADYEADFIVQDLQQKTDEREERERLDLLNPVMRSRKVALKKQLTRHIDAAELRGMTDAEVDRRIAQTFTMPREIKSGNQHARALHASGVQDAATMPGARLGTGAGTEEPEDEAHFFYTAAEDDGAAAAPEDVGSYAMTPAQAAYAAEEAAAAEQYDHFHYQQQVAEQNAYEELAMSQDSTSAAGSPRAAAYAAEPSLSVAPSASQRPSLMAGSAAASPRRSEMVKKQDGTAEIRLGTASRGHVVRLVRKPKRTATTGSTADKPKATAKVLAVKAAPAAAPVPVPATVASAIGPTAAPAAEPLSPSSSLSPSASPGLEDQQLVSSSSASERLSGPAAASLPSTPSPDAEVMAASNKGAPEPSASSSLTGAKDSSPETSRRGHSTTVQDSTEASVSAAQASMPASRTPTESSDDSHE